MNGLFKNLFILEMANNHQGDVRHGINIIRAIGKLARKHEIKAGIKFQYRNLDSFIHPDVRSKPGIPHVSRFLETRLSGDQFLQLISACRDEGLVTVCTPFDEDSVSLIQDHGIQVIKVASCSATDWPLLEAIAKAKKPVICSTGGKSIFDIDNIVSFFTHREVEFAIMHCVALYPLPSKNAQLNFIDRLRKRYPYVAIGYSGHEAPDNTDIAKIAVAKGATILERHVGLESETVKLNKYSMNPQQTEEWIQGVLAAREICGGDSDEKHIAQSEIDSLLSLMRGTYANKEIKAGETITRDKVYFAMPCAEGQTISGEFQEGMIASHDYQEHQSIVEQRSVNTINRVRGLIHDVKGMLYEANIELGKNFSLELSHHYGIDHFRTTGAFIFNVINRKYCKKIISLLPGQSHPVHFHKAKEETFHMLWGDLVVDLNDISVPLNRGDQLLIERGAKHAFSSKSGAIFEEVSTSHIIGDSYYDDPRISSRDPMERKTFIQHW